MSTSTVRSYETSGTLSGTPSAELIEQSGAVDTGAVPAYRDEAGVWQYVAPSQVSHYRDQLREEIVTVYVETTGAMSVSDSATAAVEAAGSAGGIDEVRRLAEHGWPTNRPLTGDSPELRTAIQAEAARILADA